MDLSVTIIPKSDQINSEDLLTGPITVTVESVSAGTAEQPVDFHLVEYPGRAYRPSKTMRRVIVKAWGAQSDAYAGRRMTLYRDPDVKFGGQKVGGIKISHLSHIDKAFQLALTETRGKRAVHDVKPLPDAPTKPAGKATEPTPATDKPTGEQMVALGLAFTTANITDSASKARYITETLGRELNGWDDLTAADVGTLTDALKAITATVPAEPEGWDLP